jgi:hypothetical protein
MSITDGTVLKVVATQVWPDDEVNQNVFNAVITGGGGPWDEADVLEDALDWIATIFANLNTRWSEDLNGSVVTVYEYDPIDDDWDEVGSIGWTFIPAGAGETLPRGIAGLINAKTIDPDVSGKKYVGGMLETMQSGGTLSANTLTDLANFADDWGNPFAGFTTGAGWAPVIWSVVGTVAKLMSETYIIPSEASYQRRRKKGVGI